MCNGAGASNATPLRAKPLTIGPFFSPLFWPSFGGPAFRFIGSSNLTGVIGIKYVLEMAFVYSGKHSIQ